MVGKSFVGTLREIRLYQNSTVTFDDNLFRLVQYIFEPYLVGYWPLFEEELGGTTAIDWVSG